MAPNDSAANHYWIHAVEASNKPEQALPSAALLASLSPTFGAHGAHAWPHSTTAWETITMPSTGLLPPLRPMRRICANRTLMSMMIGTTVHNLMYGIANLMEEGKLTQATELSGKLSGARGHFKQTLYVQSPRDSISRLDPLLPVALRTGDWALVLKLVSSSKPDAKLENLTFLAGQLEEFATGMDAINTGDVAAAQASSTKLDAELWHLSQNVKDAPKPPKDEPKTPFTLAVMPDALPAPLLSSLSIMSLELRASILAREKNLPSSKKLFEQAAQEERALGYREPPTYIRPVGETEGFALLAAGDATAAHEAYVSALAERPNSGFRPLWHGSQQRGCERHHEGWRRVSEVR